MVAQVWQVLEHGSNAIHALHRALAKADPEAAGQYAGTYHSLMASYPRADLALEGLARAVRLMATAAYADRARCAQAETSFDRLRETMHGVFRAAPGEFWTSPEGIPLAMHYDRA